MKRLLTSIMWFTSQKEHQEIIDDEVTVNFSGNNVQVTKFYLVQSKETSEKMNFKTDECKLGIKWELSAAGGINDWNNQLKKQWLGSLQLLPQEGVKTSRNGGTKTFPARQSTSQPAWMAVQLNWTGGWWYHLLVHDTWPVTEQTLQYQSLCLKPKPTNPTEPANQLTKPNTRLGIFSSKRNI